MRYSSAGGRDNLLFNIVVTNVSYAELLFAGRLWWRGALNHMCVRAMYGTAELKAELERDELQGTCRVD